MERQFQLNWQAFVEEAKQRRKALKLTQKKLAILAQVSTPTVSRFEGGAKDIQLSSILNIFEILGMIDKRQLIFKDSKTDFVGAKEIVQFYGQDGNKKIAFGITREALEDYFTGHAGTSTKSSSRSKISDAAKLLNIFDKNKDFIEQIARRKYLTHSATSYIKEEIIIIRSDDLF